MAFMKRMVLFMAVNLLVVATISIVLNVLQVRPYLTNHGIDMRSLAVFCLVWGMGGSLISLGLSRIMAKMAMGVKVIDPVSSSGEAAWLVQTVHQLARSADLPAMPEVGIYQSPELNAFATGPTKSRSLVAVSSGLLERMDRNQVEGVLGHEITHIANGDMVTMTLLQGVVNAFVMFAARVIAFAISQNVKEESRRGVQMMVTIVLEILLSVLGMLVVAGFSRLREFRADAGGARLSGREKMIAALEALGRGAGLVDKRAPSLAAFKISGRPGGFLALLATHPPLEVRIERLRRAY
ncbi:MAG: protease HtpX [Elusimicrobia bacterium]|nr:protease HtpX [Elusimicrobiota bacterium]